MRYGQCTNIITANQEWLDRIAHDGFDFIEGSLMAIAAATEEEFRAAKERVEHTGLKVEICNCMFPQEVRLTVNADEKKVADYVEYAFSRGQELGMKKIVLGSDKARQLPEGYDEDKAYTEFGELLRDVIAPIAERRGIMIMIEPLRKPCNFINTLPDGMRVVNIAHSPAVEILADTIHMISSGEDPKYVHEIKDHIQHVHVSDWDRELPEYKYSPELTAVLREIQLTGYDRTMSFESRVGKDENGYERALHSLKCKMGR